MHYLTTPELSKLFRATHEAKTLKSTVHHLAMLTMYYTGCRISQLTALKGEDIFEANGDVVIKIHSAKRGYDRIHKLHFDTRPEFDMSPLLELAKRRPQSLLFAGLSRQYMNKIIKKYGAECGIHSDFCHSHIFRHSSAMAVWDSTHRIGAISYFLAHRSASAAACYLSENDGKLAQSAIDSVQFE